MSETMDRKAITGKIRQLAGVLGAFGAGAMLADSSMAGIASFADISLAGAMPAHYTAALLLGGIVRSAVSGTVGKDIVKLTAIMIIFIAELFTERTSYPVYAGVTALGAVVISGTAVSLLIGEFPYKLVFYVFYGALTGYTAYALSGAIWELRSRRVIDLSKRRGLEYAVVYIVGISALSAAELPGVNAGVVIGSGAALFAAHFYRQTGGVLCGALAVCGAYLASPETGREMALLPAAALLTGCLAERTPLISALIFTGVELLLMVLTGISAGSLTYMLDVLCGAAAFLIAAPYYSDRYIASGGTSQEAAEQHMKLRREFLADTVDTVREESGKAAELMDRRTSSRRRPVSGLSAACEDCCRKPICWEMARQVTLRGFRRLEREAEASRETFPYELSDCIHKDQLIAAAGRASRERLTERLMRIRRIDMRRIAAEQMKVMGELIRQREAANETRYSAAMSGQIRSRLERHGIEVSDVIAWYTHTGRLSAELYFPAEMPQDSTRIADLLSDGLGLVLCGDGGLSSGQQQRIRIAEAPEYEAESYTASSCSSDTGDNGDTTAVFADGTGSCHIVLSDGMGSGTEAALESRMVVRLYRRLICSGAEPTAAIKLINTIMLTKCGEEGFATLDAVKIDCDDGTMTISKSGAAATLICRSGSVMKVSAPTFPIGIYAQAEAYTSEYRLSDGDTVIMFSDGIGENAYPFIKELLLSGQGIRRIAEEICGKAEKFNPTLHEDDVTVIGIRIKRRKSHID